MEIHKVEIPKDVHHDLITYIPTQTQTKVDIVHIFYQH